MAKELGLPIVELPWYVAVTLAMWVIAVVLTGASVVKFLRNRRS